MRLRFEIFPSLDQMWYGCHHLMAVTDRWYHRIGQCWIPSTAIIL